MKKIHSLLLAVLSGLLFSTAWPVHGFAPLLFVAFVPLFFVEQAVADKAYKYSFIKILPYAYVAFLIWNVLTTYWVLYSTSVGGIFAMAVNSLFMAIVFSLGHVSKKRLGKAAGNVAIASYWMAFEYLHLKWELTWPWLSLGNGFSEYFKWIQWYDYTGIFGGAVWIFVMNFMIYNILRKIIVEKEPLSSQVKSIAISALVLIVPIGISLWKYYSYDETSNPRKVVVVQPNIDPYNEKFEGMTAADQLEKLLALAEQKLDTNTDFLVGPETALVQGVWENHTEDAPAIKRLRVFLEKYPKLKIVVGLSSYRMFFKGDKIPVTARRYRGQDMWFDAYNTAMLMEKGKPVVYYHKSKLVPGVERMPYPAVFKFLEPMAINLGGMSGSLGTQKERTVFFSSDDSIGVAPEICYESIYGDYATEYIRKGANFIFIITNDGWWKDTPGHRQHCSYARLQAIEMRRSVARSANTGTSCFINQRGDMQQATKWWVPTVIAADVNANDKLTFYARFGDYIARVAVMMTALLLLWTITTALNKTKRRLG